MIDINLLPEHLRRVEGTPLPRQLTIYLAVAVSLVLVFLNVKIYMTTQNRQRELEELQTEVAKLKEQERELEALIAQIEAIRARVDAATKLVRQRVVYAKLLADLKQIVNSLGYNQANEQRQYLWLSRLDLQEGRRQNEQRKLVMEGFATGPDSRRAWQMVGQFGRSLIEYRPVATTPEGVQDDQIRGSRERLEELEKIDSNELTEEQRREKEALEAFMQHLRMHRSGGVAEEPFVSFFEPESLYTEQTWSDSVGSPDENVEMPPVGGMEFTIEIDFKAAQKQEEGLGL